MKNPISELSKIECLRPQDLNCNIFSIYDYDANSLQELLCIFFEKINECIKVSNATFKLAEWLVSVGLSQEVAKKLEHWLIDGTLANIINETIFNNLNNLLKITKDKVINVVEFGADKTGVNDSTVNLQNAFNKVLDYIYQGEEYPYLGKTVGKIIIDLAGGRYKVTDTIKLPTTVAISNVVLQNGCLIPDSWGDKTKPVLRIGSDEGHSYENVIQNVMFLGDFNYTAIYLKDTLATTIDKCDFHNAYQSVKEGKNCHETNIINCNFRNKPDHISNSIALDLNQDTKISNNTFVYYNIGIQLSSNANFIRNNHFYGMGSFAINTSNNSMFNSINNNYFDGCPIQIGRGGYSSEIINNKFVDIKKYSAIYLGQRNSGDWLQQVIIKNNNFQFSVKETHIDGSVIGNVVTATENIFKNEMVGGVIISGNKVEKCVIKEIISPNKANVSIINGFKNSFTNFKIFPSNVSFLHNENEWSNIVTSSFIVNDNLQEVGYSFESGKSNGVIKNYKSSYTSIEMPIQVRSIEKPLTTRGTLTLECNKFVNFIKFECIARAVENQGSIGYAYFNKSTNTYENQCHYFDENKLAQRSESDCFILKFNDGTYFGGIVRRIEDMSFTIEFIGDTNLQNNCHVLCYVY